MIVVKLGGSLAESGTLGAWLDTVAAHGGGRAVVVPGGGPFADAVRAAQHDLGFSDRAAHRMAVLAMEQYAVMLADIEPSLRPCATAAEIAATLCQGGIPVWLPSRMARADASIAESWDVTSDSLAAWLARRLGASRLVLVKSSAVRTDDPAALAAGGLVDAAFPAFVADAPFAILVAGPDDRTRVAAALGDGG